jgi:hypothetical protein
MEIRYLVQEINFKEMNKYIIKSLLKETKSRWENKIYRKIFQRE